jgi:hypothetical protein
MSRYKGRASAQAIEKDFPHIVEMIVTLGSFGKKLDEMHEWQPAPTIASGAAERRLDDAAAEPEMRYYLQQRTCRASIECLLRAKSGHSYPRSTCNNITSLSCGVSVWSRVTPSHLFDTVIPKL